MKKMLVLFSFFLFSIALSGVSEEKAAPVEVIQIVNFSGTIEIIYSDGTRFVIKSGEEVPPLMSGTMLRVLEGTLTLRVEDDVNVYTTGQLVRISEDMEGKWEAFLSDDTSVQDTGSKNLGSSEGAEGSESESARDLDSDAVDVEQGTGEVVSVSPSTP